MKPDGLRVLTAVRAPSLLVGDGMRHHGGRKRGLRFGVLLSLLRVGVPATLRGAAFALLQLVLGRRHALRLGTEDLLRREREFVLEVANLGRKRVERSLLRIELGLLHAHLLCLPVGSASPAARMFLRHAPSWSYFALTCRANSRMITYDHV
jgi:hypothetical protein